MNREIILEKMSAEIIKTSEQIRLYKEKLRPTKFKNEKKLAIIIDDINKKNRIIDRLDKAKLKLINLKRLIKKIDSKKFRLCIKCSRRIPVSRLLANPQNVLCGRCSLYNFLVKF